MVRDSKKFADSGNWGYAQFNYDGASDTFTPLGIGAACGFACHTIVKAKDYVFTAYPKREQQTGLSLSPRRASCGNCVKWLSCAQGGNQSSNISFWSAHPTVGLANAG
jgi:hypothetical protein